MALPADTRLVLGVPLDDLSMDETVAEIFRIVHEYREGDRPRLVATINVDFLVNCLSWRPGTPFRHPELVRVLRRAALCTADGMPLLWACSLLGRGMKERVAGSDMVPRLAAEAARCGRSLYLLGGKHEVALQAAQVLVEQNPGLRVAGVDSPFVHTLGPELADAPGEDAPVCERINRSGADILLVGFGNPKQELWFQRNRHALRVPVVIGVGGTFNFLTGAVPRAPHWMREHGLEWVFRIWVEPRRLWRRYLLGFLVYGTAMLPPIAHAWWRRAVGVFRSSSTGARDWEEEMYLSGERLVSAVRLPVCWSVDEVERLGEVVENAGDVDALILDFEGVRGFGAADAGAVMRALATLSDQGRLVYLASVPGAVRRTMRLNRCWDALEDRVCAGPRQVVARLNEVWHRVSCFVALDLGGEILTIRFCGRLEAPELAVLDIKGIAEHLAGRDVVVDLKYCAFVDNAGQAFLLKLRRETLAGGHRFVLRGAAPDVRQAFAVSDLEEVFEWGDP